MGGFLSLWDQACPAHRHAELFQRQEPVHRMGLGKVPVLAAQPGDRRGCGSSMAKRQAGVGSCLKQKFRRSVAEVSRNHGNPQARHLSACSRKQTAQPKCAGTKPQPGNARSIGKDFHSYNHKHYFFLSFKPQHALRAKPPQQSTQSRWDEPQ